MVKKTYDALCTSFKITPEPSTVKFADRILNTVCVGKITCDLFDTFERAKKRTL